MGEGKKILWNIINSFLAAVLVLIGAFSTGEITNKTIQIAVVAALLIFFNKFYDYWKGAENRFLSFV